MQDVLGVQELDGGDDLTHEVLRFFFGERPDLIEPQGNGFSQVRSDFRVQC